MLSIYEFEMQKAADEIVRELFDVQPGETFILTADTLSDMDVVNAVARSIYSAKAKPMVIQLATPPGPGRMVDDFLPAAALRAALCETDCFIEFNKMYLLYSAISDYAQKNNKKMRGLCLPAMNKDILVRLFANVDHRSLAAYLGAVKGKIEKAKHVKFEYTSGTSVEFYNKVPEQPIYSRDGYARTPGMHQLAGMIAWAPDLDTVNGTITVAGSLVPQIGILEEPAYIHLKDGVIQSVEGGRQAQEFWALMKSFNHPQMLRPAHACTGFNPKAKLTGQVGEDERLWGGTQWGFGSVGIHLIPPDGIPAPSHLDATSLNTSVILDGVPITEHGVVVDAELIELAKALGK